MNENEVTRRKDAPEFNIFYFLDFDRQEAFHSNFIRFLLNPSETHNQGHLFIENFFKIIKEENPLFPLPEQDIKKGSWFIDHERLLALMGIWILLFEIIPLSPYMLLKTK